MWAFVILVWAVTWKHKIILPASFLFICPIAIFSSQQVTQVFDNQNYPAFIAYIVFKNAFLPFIDLCNYF